MDKKVLIIGDIYIETQFFTGNVILKGLTIADKSITITGSKTVNVARVLTKLGYSVDFLAKVGNDDFADKAIQDLQKYNISSELISRSENHKTGLISVITDSKGQSSIVLFPGANESIEIHDLDLLKTKIKEYDAMYITSNLSPEILQEIGKILELDQNLILLDFPNKHNQHDLTKMTFLNFIIPNRTEAELLTETRISTIEEAFIAIKQIHRKAKTNILITLDKDGAVFLAKSDTEPIHYSTISIDTIDSTAAGDIFRAVFLSEVLNKSKIEDAITKSLNIASKSVKIKGVDATLTNLDLT